MATRQDSLALAARLNTTVVHLHRRLRRLDQGVGLPLAQASALTLLVSAGPHTIGALANLELVAAPTMTRIVSALEARGLATRERPSGDGRVVQVRATDSGRRLIREAFSARLSHLAKSLEALNSAERAQLESALPLFDRVGTTED